MPLETYVNHFLLDKYLYGRFAYCLISKQENFPMSLKQLNLNLELGQTILVGQNNEHAQITKIEFHEKSGTVAINTTAGPRNALTFRLYKGAEDKAASNPADRYR